ncbi:hypothetical protein ACFE04_030246 [Oxalis oulophora]
MESINNIENNIDHEQKITQETSMVSESIDASSGSNGVVLSRSVFTDEQMETLVKQIAAYRVISRSLLEMNKSFQEMRNVKPCLDRTGGRRKRWAPTEEQLHILEQVFVVEGEINPCKKTIKEATLELQRYGEVDEKSMVISAETELFVDDGNSESSDLAGIANIFGELDYPQTLGPLLEVDPVDFVGYSPMDSEDLIKK